MKPNTLNKQWILLFALALALVMAGCGKRQVRTRPSTPSSPSVSTPSKAGPAPKGTFKPYTVRGKKYYPLSTAHGYVEEGIASWYGKDFHGKKTANGETYNMHDMTAAHKILPMNTYLRVTNLDNNRITTVRVNDRGPFVGTRILDLSYAGAKELNVVGPGTAHVRIEAVGVAGQPAPALDRALANGRFYVQVGSFRMQDNARGLLKTLRNRGYQGSRIQQAQINGNTYWRVQAGLFKGMDQTKQAHASLKKLYPSCFVIAD